MAIHNRPSRLRITSQTKSLIVRPTTKDELRSLIEKELYYQGIDADLNFIDTSLIKDMSNLFNSLYIRNIKIDQWNTENVTDMEGMFSGCDKFNCNLSGWNVSNVEDMSYMFYLCENFSCNLSGWNVSNNVIMLLMFVACYKMTKEYYPNFYCVKH